MAYLPLSTANLPEPTISPADDASPEDYFNVALYAGNSSTQSITGVGHQPDFLWIKGRTVTGENHALVDVVRGTDKYVFSSYVGAAEDTNTNRVTSFDSDGFSIGNQGDVNTTGRNYVAWSWKAGGTAVSNTDGSITSSISANTTAGMSVVKYDGTGTAATVGHGLNEAPQLIFCKRRDRANDDWKVYAEAIGGGTHQLTLNSTAAASTNSAQWNDTDATSTVFSIGTSAATNGTNQIAYCFHSVEGFSKCSSYTGTGSSRQFVYTGFRPAFILCKNTSGTGNWILHDTKRDPYNLMTANLYPNSSSAEGNTNMVDALSNGFEVAADFFGDNNASGSTYIYMAFAENPFKYSNAR